MRPLVSICIPAYQTNQLELEYFNFLVRSIQNQSFKDYEIVVSDHSTTNEIEQLLKDSSIQYTYVQNKDKRGNSPANLNNAISFAKGSIIKVFFQDDYFYTANALEKFAEKFKDESTQWVVCGSNQQKGLDKPANARIPYYNPNIIYGKNTISSPSVLAFRRNNKLLFDENLVMLMDCEFYYRLYQLYGNPTIINDTLVTNREHPNQISSQYDYNNLTNELTYCITKHKLK